MLIEVYPGDAGPVSIVVDGAAVATLTGQPYQAFWRLVPGEHRAWVEYRDTSGNLIRSPSVTFTVIG